MCKSDPLSWCLDWAWYLSKLQNVFLQHNKTYLQLWGGQQMIHSADLSQARGVCSVSVGHNGLLGSISLSTSGFLITGFYPAHFSSSARPALLSASLCNRVNNWQRHLLDWRVWSLHFSRFASWMSPYFQDKADDIGTSCMLLHLQIKYHFGSLV